MRELNEWLAALSASERLAWAAREYEGSLLVTSSFGAGSAVMLHLVSRAAPGLPVVMLDTGFLFDETLGYRDQLAKRLGLRVDTLRSPTPAKRFLALYGDDIQRRDPDFCCAENKVAPLAPSLVGRRAWASGLRRDQGAARAELPFAEPSAEGPLKLYPIADWSARDVAAYMIEHDLPEHPLAARGYRSIGCAPCTRAALDGEGERDGRWAGTTKTECGIHAPRRPPA